MNSRDLVRRQLDARLRDYPRSQPPSEGWIRTIRLALGMTMAQLGKRLKVSAPAVAELESRETRGSVSVSKLRDAADALGCDLLIAFVPRVPLTEIIRQRATAKAEQEQSGLLHTMRLEAQDEGVAEVTDLDRSVERLLAKRPSRIWD